MTGVQTCALPISAWPVNRGIAPYARRENIYAARASAFRTATVQKLACYEYEANPWLLGHTSRFRRRYWSSGRRASTYGIRLLPVGRSKQLGGINSPTSQAKHCCLTTRSTGPATAAVVSPACGAFGTFARRAYAVRRSGPVSSNVRPRVRHSFAASTRLALEGSPVLDQGANQLRCASMFPLALPAPLRLAFI